jgi:hypothetical protein
MSKIEVGHAGGFLMSEGNRKISRRNVTVLSGQNLLAGAVLGAVSHGTASSAANAGNTGNGVMGAVTVGAGALPGVYRLTVIEPGANVGTFRVEDPNGVEIGTGVVAAAFNKGGLSFTLADGATDFVAGDGFAITVAVGSGKVKEYNPANTDGSEVPVGVLLSAVDASAADVAGVMFDRLCEVNKNELVWFSGATSQNKTDALAVLEQRNIFAR